MKILNQVTGLMWVVFLMAAVSPAAAGEQVRVFEMGEGGQTVTFPMTEAEIAAEKELKSRQPTSRNNRQNHDDAALKVFEMGESGQTVAYPITTEEAAVRQAEKQKRQALRQAYETGFKGRVIEFEMGESGQTVTFEVPETAIAPEEDRMAWRKAKDMKTQGEYQTR